MQRFKRLFLNKEADALNFCTWLFLLCLGPLLALAIELVHYPSQLSAGLAMRIVAAELVSEGELPYVDFWDWTQPVIYEIFKYPCLLAGFLKDVGQPVIPAILIPPLIFAFALLAFALATALYLQAGRGSIAGSQDEQSFSDFTTACFFGYALTALLARFDFGELQYLLLICLFPWLLLRSYVHSGRRVHPAFSVLTGSLAGLGACLDLPFLGVFIILELALLLQSRRWRTLGSPDCLAFVLTVALNLFWLSHLESSVGNAFWNWTMPLKWLSYFVLEPGIFGPTSCPRRVDVLYCLCATGCIAFVWHRRHSWLAALAALLFAGFFLFLFEGNGLSQNLILTIFAASAIFSGFASVFVRYWLGLLGEKGARLSPLLQSQIVLVLMAWTATTLTCGSLAQDRQSLQAETSAGYRKGEISIAQLIEESTAQRDKVSVLCTSPAPVYSYLALSGRKPGGYLLFAKPLVLFKWLKENATLTGAMKDFYDFINNRLTNDIEQQQSSALVVCDDSIWDCYGRQSSLPLLERYYQKSARPGQYFSHKNHQPAEYCGLKYSPMLFVRKPVASQ